MKKLMLFAVMLLAAVGVVNAAVIVTYNDEVLPVNAKSLLSTHFKAKINHIKIDKNLVGNIDEYDVVLQNGTEVEFDGHGNLKEVDAGNNTVPAGLILNPIKTYVKKNCKNQKIRQLEVKKNNYIIELFDGRELVFDRSGGFIKENR